MKAGRIFWAGNIGGDWLITLTEFQTTNLDVCEKGSEGPLSGALSGYE